MAVPVANIIEKVKDLNGELTSGDDARILRWINDERRFIETRSSGRAAKLNLTSATEDVTADEELVPLPLNFKELHGKNPVQILSDGDYVPAAEVDRGEFRLWDTSNVTFGTDEFYYAIRDAYLVLRPIPTANVTDGVRVDFYRYVADLESNDSIAVRWEPFQEVLSTGAALRSGIRFEDGRQELTLHYDGRLFPWIIKEFGERSRVPMQMKAVRPNRARRSRFGRTS